VTGGPRRGRVALPSVVAGALLAFSLPPWGWWPLGPLGAAVLYWRLAGLPARTRLWAGWLAGLGCDVIGLMWARAFNWYGALVLMLVEALFVAVAALLTPPHHGRAPAFVAANTLAEAVRMTWPFGGLPVGGVFLGQADGPLLVVARVGGPLLLTAAVWTGGVAVATMVAGARRRAGAPRPGRGAVVLAGLAGVAVVASLCPDGGAPVRTVTAAAVQGGGRRGTSMEEVAPSTVFSAQLAAMRPLAAPGRAPQLVLWPENVIALDGPLAGSPQGATVRALARSLHVTLVAGVTEPVGTTRFRNEVVVWAPSGRIVATFEKVHRVPFGEYIPYRSFFAHLANLSGVPLDAIAGHATGLLRTPVGPLGVLVSFETFFAARSRTSVRAGAEALVVPTNTTSYADSQMPAQELAADRVQAVETGRDLLQASPTGFSAAVSNDGAVRARSSLGRAQVVRTSLPLRRGDTVYDHLGDMPVLIVAGVALVAGWSRSRRARRHS